MNLLLDELFNEDFREADDLKGLKLDRLKVDSYLFSIDLMEEVEVRLVSNQIKLSTNTVKLPTKTNQ